MSVIVERNGPVTTLVIARPERRNAVDRPTAQALADAGVAPRRRYSLVMDELWRILRASSGMVERVDSLTRLNRTIGVGQMMITHSMTDLASLAAQEDRARAQGFVERSKMLFLGGLPHREMDLLRGVMSFSDA